MKKILLRLIIVVLFIPLSICIPLQLIYLLIKYIINGDTDDVFYEDPLPFLVKQKLTKKYNL